MKHKGLFRDVMSKVMSASRAKAMRTIVGLDQVQALGRHLKAAGRFSSFLMQHGTCNTVDSGVDDGSNDDTQV